MAVAAPYIISALIGLALSFAGSMVVNYLRRDPDSGPVSNGHLVTKRDHQERLPRIYGRTRVGVNQVFIHTTGGSNKYLHMICTLSEGVIKGLVRQDGTTYETTATNLPTSNPPLVYFDETLFTQFEAANVRVEFYDGSATQGICSTLQTAYPSWADALRNTAYLYIRLKYDRDRYMIQPGSITAVIDGLECYDPIVPTTAHTDNPAICAYNYLTATSFRGGMGIPAADIDTSSLSDFKDYCNTKSWTANLPIYEGKPDADNLQAILDGGRGRVIESGGKIKFRFFDLNHESTVMNLTDEDIITDEDGAAQLEFSQPDIMDRPNTVRVKFLNGKDYKYTVDDFVLTDDDAVEDDGGDKRELTVNVHGLSDIDLAQKMGNYHLERARYNRTLSGHFGRRCLGLEPMDLTTLTFAPFGWVQKYFRVLGVQIQPDYTVQLQLIEEATALYDDTYDAAALQWYDTTLDSPFDEPPEVINVSYSEEVYSERERSRSRIVVDFDPPATADAPFWIHANVWVRREATGTWEFRTKAGERGGNSNYTLDDVQEGVTYFIKLQSETIHGVVEDFDNAYTVQHLVTGMNSNPSNISAMTATANGSTVSLSATWSGDDDVANFEIRVGDSFNDGVVVTIAPAHSNDLRAMINAVRPGTFTFWAAALNNAGKYSSTPVSAVVEVFSPPGYTELATYGSWQWDFTTGTFTNAEKTTHTFGGTSYDALKCSHTAGNLVGTWQSATHDLGAVEKVKVWGDFTTDLDSADKKWSSNWTTGVAWPPAAGTSWANIFTLQASGKLTAKLLAQDSDSNWSSAKEYDFFEMQSAEVENRYLRVEVTITDPNVGSNIFLKELNMYAYEGPA